MELEFLSLNSIYKMGLVNSMICVDLRVFGNIIVLHDKLGFDFLEIGSL